MMKISEIGEFVLIDENSNQYKLNCGTNLIYLKDSHVFIGDNANTYRNSADTIFTITFTDTELFLMKSSGRIYVGGREVVDKSRDLAEGDIISTEKIRLNFKFVYEDKNLEKIIDFFMDGQLYHIINMDRIFYEYAKMLKITDKKAISNVMAAIDIPEIDKVGE